MAGEDGSEVAWHVVVMEQVAWCGGRMQSQWWGKCGEQCEPGMKCMAGTKRKKQVSNEMV